MALDKATIAKRYAVALFELTHDQGTDADTLAELTAIRDILVQNPEFTKALLSLRIDEAAKRNMLATLSEGTSQVVANLIQMTYDYRRIQNLPAIITKYEELVNEAAGVVNAEVQTAVPLSDEQVTRLKEQLVQRYQANEVRLTQIVDEDLLGGVIVKANDQILDGSLATKLAAIRQSIIR
ncbi:F0F1 ATP synthase subunit delta [Weissella paramesenteroides]|uniref:ATP synthase F1 subunit delta n=1 Tax=Weissella paramesenteroides TaxID=1249 RepID=UPI00112D54A9|nr:ATP synthase F1 subunit delta [Weissella paramesenteroides]KAA8441941.1 F0F1 ATP synthase subunit delta [Weissella paramesenteroides]KAA8442185.1 F0F1 ATP synthase subunit delta [Weissella paramesenteroides]KAA8443578.1 F0F1 ATP synthase subunit delta [Weissella paramesenteroides]KAA8447082.1 F0F1 ATP synthase subunit delta [Weissella paramesenteroides]KAA8447468.1 F0F1 ATP synthase subunit delta [Weissella paramesenteroides]